MTAGRALPVVPATTPRHSPRSLRPNRRGYAPDPAMMGLPSHTRLYLGLWFAGNLDQGAGAGIVKDHLPNVQALDNARGITQHHFFSL